MTIGRHDVHASRRVARVVLFALSAALLAGWAGNTDSRGSIASSHAAPIAASRMVQDRVDALRARFRVAAPRSMDPLAGWVRARRAPAATLPALGAAVASGFELRDGAVHALIPAAAKRGVARSASVALPLHAGDPVRLEDDTSHVAVSFALRGASAAPLTAAGGIAMYAGALGGADVLHRVHATGTEDFVVFEQRPAQQAIAYDVDVSRVAGLRLVGNTLEFLDASGAPRLRVAPPYVVDATGARTEARLAVTGCAFDSSPRAPWGRAVTPSGASHCGVSVAWNVAAYPAMLDPGWTTTGSMATGRKHHTATLLESGQVLIAGGAITSSSATASAELYDPTSRSFAATSSMAVARFVQIAALLGSGKVLVAGGATDGSLDATSDAELYDETTGTFSPTTHPMTTARRLFSATLLQSGEVLITGGFASSEDPSALSSAELYEPTSGEFVTAAGPMSSASGGHTSTLLGSGKVLVAGGLDGAGVFLSRADLFDPGTKTFAPTGSMPAAHIDACAVRLHSGKVLVVGGFYGPSPASGTGASSAWLYNEDAGTFAAAGSMSAGRYFHTATLLDSGSVLVAGGWPDTASTPIASAEMFDPDTGTFAPAGSMLVARGAGTATLLRSGDVLIAGGWGFDALEAAEVFTVGSGDGGVDAGGDASDGGVDAGRDASDGGPGKAEPAASSGCSCRMVQHRSVPPNALLWLAAGATIAIRRRRRPRTRAHAVRRAALLAALAATASCGSGDAGGGGPSGPPLPALTSSVPADGDGNVSRTAWVALTFAAKVDTASLAGVTLSCAGKQREAEVSLLGDSLVVVNPAADLPATTACQVAWRGSGGRASIGFTVAATGAPATVMYDRTDAALLAPLPDDFDLVDDATTKTGKHVVVPSPDRPNDVRNITAALAASALSADGWSPLSPIVVALSDAPDPSTLPKTPGDSVDPLATVGLFDVDPASPARGERVPSVVEIRDEADGSGGTTSHSLLVFPNRPLDPQHEYAVVITRRALVDPTRPLDPTSFEASVLGVTGLGTAPEFATGRGLVGDVLDALAKHVTPPIHPQDIAAAVRFTTRSTDEFPRDPLAIRRQTVASTPSYAVTSVDAGSSAGVAAVVHGTFRAYTWRDANNFLVRDANGDPVPQGTTDLPFVLALPTQATNGKVPIIMYQHGSPGTAEVEVPAITRTQGLAAAGFAVIGFTDVPNREVIKTGGNDALIQAMFVSVLTQHRLPDYDVASFADQLALLHTIPALADLDVLPAGAPDGKPELDVQKPLGYLGMSQGSVRGTELVAYAPEIHAAALVVGGGDSGAQLIHQAGTVYPAVHRFFPNVTHTEFYMGCVLFEVAQDPQDQLNHARHWSREPQPLGSTGRTSLLTFEGLGDTLVPSVATEGAAWAFGIPQLGTVHRAVPGLVTVAGPVTANVDPDTTAAFVQYAAAGVPDVTASPDCAKAGDTEGHLCAWFAASAIAQRLEFFKTALSGRAPTIPAADN